MLTHLLRTNQDEKTETDASKETLKGEQGTERKPDDPATDVPANAQKNIQKDSDSDSVQNSDNASYHSDSESELTELEVQSKEEPPSTNSSVQKSETEEPATTTKTQQAQAPINRSNFNGNSKIVSQDRDLPKRELAQQAQQRLQPLPQPSLPPMHQPSLPQVQAKTQPLAQQPQYAQYPSLAPRAEGYRVAAVRESRIKDRPTTQDASASALKIKIELDLEVEVDLYARVKGDVTIGLM
jgi:hypothetical protein